MNELGQSMGSQLVSVGKVYISVEIYQADDHWFAAVDNATIIGDGNSQEEALRSWTEEFEYKRCMAIRLMESGIKLSDRTRSEVEWLASFR